jgi:hypothetical protein
MTKRVQPPRQLLITIGILVVVSIVSNLLIEALKVSAPDEMNKSILLLGVPFLSLFIAILLGFIYFIFVVASRLNGVVERRVYRPIEALIITGIVIGVIGMFQPFTIFGYQYGFILLLFSTLAFIVWSHVTPKGEINNEEVGPVSVREVIEHEAEIPDELRHHAPSQTTQEVLSRHASDEV